MLDRLGELIEQFLVALGLALSRLSADQKSMITLMLTFLLVAAVVARVLQIMHS
jgi:hypothetical protein